MRWCYWIRIRTSSLIILKQFAPVGDMELWCTTAGRCNLIGNLSRNHGVEELGQGWVGRVVAHWSVFGWRTLFLAKNLDFHPLRNFPWLALLKPALTLSGKYQGTEKVTYLAVWGHQHQHQHDSDRMSISTNRHQQHQSASESISIGINRHQSESKSFNQYQSASININQYQSASININQHQSMTTSSMYIGINALIKSEKVAANQ